MSPLAIVRSLFAAAAFAVVTLPAQQSRPRFELPDPPYDYTEIAVPPGLDDHASRFLFRFGDDAAARTAFNARTALGRVLFHDPLLSKNRSISCASCHDQRRAFADGSAKSTGFHGGKTRRNAMSIADLASNEAGFFWDAREKTLEGMVLRPIQDPIEMGLDLAALRARLRAEPGYDELFTAAFGNDHETIEQIAGALATFVRSIRSLQSKYDVGYGAAEDIDADFPNFTPEENRGKRLFFGERRSRDRSCAACHMNRQQTCCASVVTPQPLEFHSDQCRNNGIDDGQGNEDPGLARLTGRSADRGKFRAPSLRNVELTGPYMHDGRFATLEAVVAFYADRVRAHPALDPLLSPAPGGSWDSSIAANRPLPTGPASITGAVLGFPMTSRQQADLVAFLKTLTDRELVRDPRFSDPFVAARGR